jgi:hypothetical protein
VGELGICEPRQLTEEDFKLKANLTPPAWSGAHRGTIAALPPIRFAADLVQERVAEAVEDVVNHPSHYKDRVPGIECISVTEFFPFCEGNAIKYIWRAGLKGGKNKQIEDLRKAAWYIERAISKLEE